MPDIEQWRERLRTQLRRVPVRVKDGTVQMARDFKKFHEEVNKKLDRARLSETDMLRLQAEVNRWYSESAA